MLKCALKSAKIIYTFVVSMHFEVFTDSDLNFLKPLEPEGWGDLLPRFNFFLGHDFIRPVKLVLNDQMVAVGATILLPHTAWLACIITHPHFRKQGLGEKMTRYLIDNIDRTEISSVNLIATELGYPLYKRMGFITDSIYQHFAAVPAVTNSIFDTHITVANVNDWKDVQLLDKQCSGEERGPLLKHYLDSAMLYKEKNELIGYYYPDLGEGLIVSQTEAAGLALLKLRSRQKKNAVIPVGNKSAMHWMLDAGLQPFRISRRMYIGHPIAWQPQFLYNRISGQLG